MNVCETLLTLSVKQNVWFLHVVFTYVLGKSLLWISDFIAPISIWCKWEETYCICISKDRISVFLKIGMFFAVIAYFFNNLIILPGCLVLCIEPSHWQFGRHELVLRDGKGWLCKMLLLVCMLMHNKCSHMDLANPCLSLLTWRPV